MFSKTRPVNHYEDMPKVPDNHSYSDLYLDPITVIQCPEVNDYTEPHLYLEPIADFDQSKLSKELAKPSLKAPTKDDLPRKKPRTKTVVFCVILLIMITNALTFIGTYFLRSDQDQKSPSPLYYLIQTSDSGNRTLHNTPDIYKYYTKLDMTTNFRSKTTLKFGVKTCQNAYVLLSDVENLNSSRFYELWIINGNGNGSSNVGLRRSDLSITRAAPSGLLACDTFRYLKLTWNNAGYFQVMAINHPNFGSKIVFDATDVFPFLLTGIGVRTGYGWTGVWKFYVN